MTSAFELLAKALIEKIRDVNKRKIKFFMGVEYGRTNI
jgi:hypothetical protein